MGSHLRCYPFILFEINLVVHTKYINNIFKNICTLDCVKRKYIYLLFYSSNKNKGVS